MQAADNLRLSTGSINQPFIACSLLMIVSKDVLVSDEMMDRLILSNKDINNMYFFFILEKKLHLCQSGRVPGVCVLQCLF